MNNFKKLLILLSPQERKQGGFLLIMIFIMALLDMIGVASILPFMAVLANPEVIETNFILKKIFYISKIFGVENNQQFIFALGVFVFLLLVISLIFKAFTTLMQLKFVQLRQFSISKRLVEGYLHQPYSWFLSRHSADLGKTILSEVGQVVANGVAPLMELIAKGMIVIMLLALLVIANPKLTFIVGLILVSAYGLIYYFTQGYLGRIGKESLKNNQLRFVAVSEAFGAAKEVKIGGLEQTYINRFSDPALTFARNQAYAMVVRQLPRFGLEAVAFGGIMLVILYLLKQTGTFNNALPIISLYAFAGYRLMPALQQIYASFTQLTFVGPSLDKLYDDIKNLKPIILSDDKDIIPLSKTITLKNIHYNYPDSSRTALKDISMNIPAKNIVGLVGATGCGKTTTVDIILGLLEAQNGTLEVDGNVITKKNSKAWRRSIGYVPQHIYLSDDTIEANIAFGVDHDDINQEDVKKASKIANLHSFIAEELPDQYKTTIGERGVRLSGGQRQRIGIARAMYHNPQVLILDEATSALDNQTEKIVMDAINNLNKDTTIILIAHRLTTVKKCDIIFQLDKGKLISKGTFDELLTTDDNFKSMSQKN